eukprot:Lithocolla_globosa_v1_NODE_516_length_3842_cov_8.723792.p1 type:complete len:882 gc:universal NODE_516_length_3842_cov_8.723792:125-2770(+)
MLVCLCLIAVVGGYQVSTNQNFYGEGQPIHITFSGMENELDRLNISPRPFVEDNSVSWSYGSGSETPPSVLIASGTATQANPGDGKWHANLLPAVPDAGMPVASFYAFEVRENCPDNGVMNPDTGVCVCSTGFGGILTWIQHSRYYFGTCEPCSDFVGNGDNIASCSACTSQECTEGVCADGYHSLEDGSCTSCSSYSESEPSISTCELCDRTKCVQGTCAEGFHSLSGTSCVPCSNYESASIEECTLCTSSSCTSGTCKSGYYAGGSGINLDCISCQSYAMVPSIASCDECTGSTCLVGTCQIGYYNLDGTSCTSCSEFALGTIASCSECTSDGCDVGSCQSGFHSFTSDGCTSCDSYVSQIDQLTECWTCDDTNCLTGSCETEYVFFADGCVYSPREPCPAELLENVWWPETLVSTTAIGQCDQGYYAEITEPERPCPLEATWDLPNSFCTACPFDLYKDTIGNDACLSCPPGSVTASTGTIDPEGCICRAGYELVSGQCSPCPIGSYQPSLGGDSCILCPGNSTTSSTVTTAMTSCLCSPGFSPWLGSCQACPQGTYKSGLGDLECQYCPSQSNSPAGSDSFLDCVCIPGFEFVESSCVEIYCPEEVSPIATWPTTKANASANGVCVEGALGEPVRFCSITGEWEEPSSSCEISSCNSSYINGILFPATPSNTYVEGDTCPDNSTAFAFCSVSGLSLVIGCGETTCPPIVDIDTLTIWAPETVNQTQIGQCTQGYQGVVTRSCTEAGWGMVSGTCEQIYCEPEYASFSSWLGAAGTTVSAFCEPGTMSVDIPRRSCLISGEWSDFITSPCKQLFCPFIQEETESWGVTKAGDSSLGECVAGYQGIGRIFTLNVLLVAKGLTVLIHQPVYLAPNCLPQL